MVVGIMFPLMFFALIALVVVVPLVFWIVSLVEVLGAPEQAFGPPWDNGKNAWTLGLVIGLLLPFGALVAAIVWWSQGRKALRLGQPVPKPFWAPARTYPYPYPPQQLPPQPPQPPS